MLSTTELSLINNVAKIASKVGVIPWDFDPKTRQIFLTRSKWKRPSFIFYSVLFFWYSIFVVLRLPTSIENFKETGRLDNLSFHLIHVVFAIGAVIVNYFSLTCSSEVLSVLNNAIKLNAELDSLQGKKLRERCLQVLNFGSVIGCISFACTFLINPTFPGHIFSVLAHDSIHPLLHWTCYFVNFAWEIIRIADECMLFVLFLNIEFVYIFTSNFWLGRICQETKCSEEGEEGTKDKYKSAQISFSLYRQLTILNILHNISLGKYFLSSMKLGMGLAYGIYFFIIVRLRNYVDLFVYATAMALCPTFLVLLVCSTYGMSTIYRLSIKFKNFIRKSQSSHGNGSLSMSQVKKLSRILRSCLPIRCKIGSLYSLEKDAKATLVQWLITETMNILLASN